MDLARIKRCVADSSGASRMTMIELSEMKRKPLMELVKKDGVFYKGRYLSKSSVGDILCSLLQVVPTEPLEKPKAEPKKRKAEPKPKKPKAEPKPKKPKAEPKPKKPKAEPKPKKPKAAPQPPPKEAKKICFDPELERQIKNLTTIFKGFGKTFQGEVKEEHWKIWMLEYKKLMLKIHPDKLGDADYKKRCSDLLAKLTGARDDAVKNFKGHPQFRS